MKSSWIVEMTCTVTKSVVVDGCTEEQARNEPWTYAVQETETGMSDWQVEKVEPNE